MVSKLQCVSGGVIAKVAQYIYFEPILAVTNL